MNAVIKPQPCPCCAAKDQQIAQLQQAVQQQDSMLKFADARINHQTVRINQLIEHAGPPNGIERRQFRGMWAAEKAAAASAGVKL